MSEMDLALEAEISTRHLSYLETSRSQPSREMLLLAEKLDIPLRERNVVLVSAGYAPVYLGFRCSFEASLTPTMRTGC
jgi:hypothetical protein